MSGPALRQRDAHHAIHHAALGEAEELTALFEAQIADGDFSRAREVAAVVVEHWETRTLRHAQEEEEGLYLEMKELDESRSVLICRLTRDHDLMRAWVSEAGKLAESGREEDLRAAGTLFTALLVLVVQHSRDEEAGLGLF